MRHYIVLSLFLLTSLAAKSQYQKKSSLFAEIGGPGIAFSINYDRMFPLIGKSKIALGIGVTSPGRLIDRSTVTGFPIQLNYMSGLRHHFELGGAINFLTRNSQALLFGRIGYRYQKPTGGFLFRAGVTPLINTITLSTGYKNILEGAGFAPWAGISLGFTF